MRQHKLFQSLITYLNLIRVKQWIKNFLVFIPVISAKLLNANNCVLVIIGFFSFSFASSFIYIINDLRDIEKDRLNASKKKRPLPSGKINKKQAIIISIIMIIICVLLNVCIYNLSNSANILLSFLIIASYIIINLLYSFGLKNVAILDVAIIAAGFILRVYYGALILNIEVSPWLFLTIMNASLFLSLGKRKKEILCSKDSRTVLKEYNEQFLDKFQYVSLGLTLVFYSLWAIEQNEKSLVFTIPIVTIIFMRYSLVMEYNNEGDPTTILYTDKILLLLCIIYGIIMFVLLGGGLN